MLGASSNIACWCGASGSFPGIAFQSGSSERAQFTLIDEPCTRKFLIDSVKSSGSVPWSHRRRKVRRGSRLLATRRARYSSPFARHTPRHTSPSTMKRATSALVFTSTPMSCTERNRALAMPLMPPFT